MMRNYYEILGVSQSASQNEIKSAYHKLIARHHPDHTKDPNSAHLAVLLNEAYATLKDERKRSLYDSRFGTFDAQAPSRQETSRKEQAPIADIVCSKCQRHDATLRLALMYYVLSFLIVTHRKGSSGIWCSKCRTIEAAKWTLLSGAFGWWGFPWGLFYTLHALVVNALGGEQPKPENANLLRILGDQLYSKGKYQEAAKALEKSLQFEANPDAENLLHFVLGLKREETSKPDPWAFAPVLPTATVVTVLSIIIYIVASQPSGYQSVYVAPSGIQAPVRSSSASGSTSRSKVNSDIEQLASIVEAKAPITGSHREGTTVITDHVLDRSKFDEMK